MMKNKKTDIANETLGAIPKKFTYIGIIISIATVIILIFAFNLLFVS